MRCPKCEGHMHPHFLSVHICLRCGNKVDGNDDTKHNC